MSLYTIAEIGHKLFQYFAIGDPQEFLSKAEVEKHDQYMQKFDFDLSSLVDVLLPLEHLRDIILDNISIYVIKPKTDDEKQLYLYFGKLLAFYALTKKLAASIKSEEGIFLLTMIEGELNYFSEDIEADTLFAKYPQLQEPVLKGLKDCIERLATIIRTPSISQNTQLPHFLSLGLNETSLIEIVNVIGTFLNYASDAEIQQAGFESLEDWTTFIYEVYDECTLIFYTHQAYVHVPESALEFIGDAPRLHKKIALLKRKNATLYFLTNYYAFLHFIINNTKAQEDEHNLKKMLAFTDRLGEYYHKSVVNPFHLPFMEVLNSLVKITNALEDMLANGIRIEARKNVLELTIQELHLNDILAALTDLCYEYIDYVRNENTNDGNTLEKLYLAIFDTVIKTPLDLRTYKIPPRYQQEVLNRFKEDFLYQFSESEVNCGLQYPLLFEMLALYYFTYSLSIDEEYLSITHVPVLLYEKVLAFIRTPSYRTVYVRLSEYFRHILRHTLRYMKYICNFSTENAFIIRSLILDFKIIATFAQGTREYFELEDGLCGGYVYQMAEYFLIKQNPKTQIGRWQTQNSPFEISVPSPFQKVIANQRTYDFQSKPLHTVTTAIQMQSAFSAFRFHSGAEIAEKLLELIQDHPGSVLILGMWQSGNKIGHAVACFLDGNILHFFCATHSWVSIPYDKANPKLHALLHTLFAELAFFDVYTHFWIGIIYRTWEAIPVDSRNYHYEREEGNIPYAYESPTNQELMDLGFFHFQNSYAKLCEEIDNLLSIPPE